jgi:cytochrome c biogenesis protein CcmG, thiol:disulfide interchange protein DsbE
MSAAPVEPNSGQSESAATSALAKGPPDPATEQEGPRGKLRYLVPLGIFLLLLVVLVVGLVRAPEKENIPSPLIGKSAPQFSLPSLTAGHSPVSTEQLKGHWTVVNVWGSWCYVCRIEHPLLLTIHQQTQIPIIGIDWNDDENDARGWLAQLGDPYSEIGVDRDGRTAIDWGVYGAPESFLINPSGQVVYKQVGAITPQAWQREFVSRIGSSARISLPPATGS